MSERGLFITVEGGEGVGKSTNMLWLEDFLRKNGVDVVVTREPGGTPLSEEIRQLLLLVRDGQMGSMTELLLIFAARAEHIKEVIEPALAAGKWVLCDRFTDATYAYQSGGRGVSADTVRQLETLVQGELRPDYTILLDVPVATGMGRARDRGELDRIEQETMDFFERVRRSYLTQAENSSGRFRVVDASVPLEKVQKQLLKLGAELLSCWRVRQSEE
ncbi:MAG: dTMP kinase [Halioglobus sp.]|jgi:dTMP kinase